ncbi:hypothetical protein [Paractinoplanes globisporus]|uniref:Secreted protein n=1 Tax=Paractinoplanes globisporus TaxID=113565 RepID=A0ABW6WLI2_9ACTN|nr:hypothetical protein [Actinoplanes globisporus]
MAWLLPLSLPLESDGELFVVEDVDELSDEVDVDVEESVVEELVVESAAWAATPTTTVPATLAATKAPVISDARRSPVSRFICVAPPFVDDTTNRAQRASL